MQMEKLFLTNGCGRKLFVLVAEADSELASCSTEPSQRHRLASGRMPMNGHLPDDVHQELLAPSITLETDETNVRYVVLLLLQSAG